MWVMGAHEIAEYLGVSRQRVTQLTNSAHFPPAAATLAMGKVWDGRDIERWAAERGRPTKPATDG